MRSPRRRFPAVASLVGVLLAPELAAQTCARAFGPLDAGLRTSQTVAYDQIWSMVARGSNRWFCAWSEGQDVYARLFNLSLSPLGSQFLVDTVLNVGIQDEPAICAGT